VRAGWLAHWRALAGVLFFALIVVSVARAGYALIVSRPIPAPEVIISLASHEWDRLPVAAQWALTFETADILLTEPREVTPYNCHDCERRVDHLRALGIDVARVHVVKLTTDGTHGEARAALEFARVTGVQRLLIVTSPYHTRRALAVFRKVFDGSGVTLGVTPASASTKVKPATWWWQPDDRSYVPYEWAAMTYYAWHYGVLPF
jgi:uncharacterized SAM-binding protein YcdF (DUF218 family)